MNLSTLDICAVGGYFLVMAWFGYLTRRTKTFQEFSVGKHSVPALMVFASLAATIVGPGFSIGITSKSWNMGFFFYFLTVTYAAQVLFTGFCFAPRLSRERDCHTLGDVMRKRYGRFSQLLTGIISVGICIGFTAIMGKIGGETLHTVTGWRMDLCLILVTGTTALLTFTGGLRATIATEAVQFTLISVMVSVMLLVAIWKCPDSFANLAARANALTSKAGAGMTVWQIIGIAVSFMLGETLLPPYANRALAAKSEKASKSGFLLAGAFTIAWLGIVATLGIVAHPLLPADTKPDNVFVDLGHAVLAPGIFGILLAAIIAIVMSSQESVLNASAVAFVRDMVHIFRPISESATLLLAKVSTLAIAAVAIIVARFAPSIMSGLLILYSLWVPTILVPLLAGLYLKETKPLAGWLSILAGGAASLVWQLWLKEPHHIPAILIGLLTSVVFFGVGHFCGRTSQNPADIDLLKTVQTEL